MMRNQNLLSASTHTSTQRSLGDQMRSLRASLAALVTTLVFAVGTVQLAHAADKPTTDDSFVRDSFSNAQIEIAMSQVALEKSGSTNTKKLAKAIIKDNGSANEKLRALASTRRLSVPAQLDKDQLQQLQQLKNSDKKSFDALYSQHLKQTHVESMQLFDEVAKNPRADAELRVFASQRLTAIKKQQQMLDKIAAGASGNAAKSTQRQAAL